MTDTSPALQTALAYYQAWTSHDLDKAMNYIADDIVCDLPGGRLEGADAYRGFLGPLVQNRPSRMARSPTAGSSSTRPRSTPPRKPRADSSPGTAGGYDPGPGDRGHSHATAAAAADARDLHPRTEGVRYLLAAYELGEDKLDGHIKPRKTRTRFPGVLPLPALSLPARGPHRDRLRQLQPAPDHHAYDERLRRIIDWANESCCPSSGAGVLPFGPAVARLFRRV